VALTLARQRLMTAVFDYYELAHPNEGVGSGFNYKTVPHITLKSIANNEPPATETLYDQPLVDRKKHRVSGPFTVEAVPAPAVKSVDELLPSPPFPLPLGEGGRRPGEGKQSLAPDLLAFARHLRKEQTDAEQILWALLRDRRLAGFKFRQQHPIEPYVLDFYCHEARLCIELDGGQHNEPEVKTRDEKRAAFLNGRGIRVLRFWDHEVMKETEAVLEAIYDALTPALSQREREFATDVSIARSGETLRQGEWRDELLRAGIRGKAGQYIRFARLEPLPGCRHLHADGETRPSDEGADSVREKGTAYAPQRIVVSFGPEHAPLEQRQVAQAIEEAQTLVPKPKLIVFAAFQFDPEAAKDIDETNWPGVTLLKAQMNADLLTDDLKKKRASNESFWLIGQPDVRLERIAKGEDKGKWRVSIEGFDYYNTKTGGIESGGAGQIAVWLLDTDYDGRSLYPRQVFFPQAGKKEGWARLAKNLKAEIDEDLIEAYGGAVSLPFEPGEHKRIAVKIVDDRGIESLKIVEVD
jgi:adenine-specific DNA-methyltransferase